MTDDPRAYELALCARCAEGERTAIAELEARYFPEIDRAIAGLDREGDLVAEIRQRVRARLFVGSRVHGGAVRDTDSEPRGRSPLLGGEENAKVDTKTTGVATPGTPLLGAEENASVDTPTPVLDGQQNVNTRTKGQAPGITKFAGAGPLGRWLVVVATREALMYLRSTRRERARAHAASELAARDYELHVLRREYRPAFEQAFADALAGLSSKDRNLLYYHLVGGLGIDRIGALYRVHRVTAFRWLRDARAALVVRTRELLAERMELATDELESLLRLVQSRASVSVERLLRQARTDSIPA